MTETAEQFIIRKKESDIGSERTFKDITRTCSHIYKIVAVTYMIESHYREKVFELQRLKHLNTINEDGTEKDRTLMMTNISYMPKITYRVGYYIIGKIGRAEGKWWWGQSAPLFFDNDLMLLIEKAKEEGTIL